MNMYVENPGMKKSKSITLEGSFSAVSRPTFVIQYSFCSMFSRSTRFAHFCTAPKLKNLAKRSGTLNLSIRILSAMSANNRNFAKSTDVCRFGGADDDHCMWCVQCRDRDEGDGMCIFCPEKLSVKTLKAQQQRRRRQQQQERKRLGSSDEAKVDLRYHCNGFVLDL